MNGEGRDSLKEYVIEILTHQKKITYQFTNVIGLVICEPILKVPIYPELRLLRKKHYKF